MNPRFPRDLAKKDVIRALANLGFAIDREREHIALVRPSESGSTLLILPNHRRIKMVTLLNACSRAGIAREDILRALGS
jgi:hypothetical protein